MTPSPTITGARFIAETLKGYGVTHVFYMDAILRKTLVEMEELGLRRIMTHSEKAAAYMADGYARASHRPGVCMAQNVGAANLASGLQDAWLGCSPVIALTGKKPPILQYRHAYQEIDHHPLFEPVTKYNVEVSVSAQLPFQLRQAFREATTNTPAPVHLDLLGHNGRLLEDASGNFPVRVEEKFTRYPAYRPEPDQAEIQLAAQAITAAQRPVIVVGGGVRLSSAQAEVVALAEHLSIPVATSVNGKGTILDAHPLSVGVVGSYSARCANQVVFEADLVIYIGSNTGDQVTHTYTVPAVGTSVIQIDINAAEIGRSYVGALGVVGDAKKAVAKLFQAFPNKRENEMWLQRGHQLVQAWRDEIEPLRQSDALPIRPERLCKELTEALPENAVLVSDTGYSAIWTATMVYLTHPEQTYLRAAGSLGWAFPAALGVKCAVPDRPVICFTGDGGVWYHLAEMETARRFNINTVTIVNNNNGLAQGIPDIEKIYSGRNGSPEELYRFESVNFSRIAQEMGCLGIRVENPAEIREAIRRGLMANRPTIIEVMTGINYHAPNPWSPGT
ncbi:MAG: thiamine pyrophosphate-binding protein [Anaerolineales bacterium]